MWIIALDVLYVFNAVDVFFLIIFIALINQNFFAHFLAFLSGQEKGKKERNKE